MYRIRLLLAMALLAGALGFHAPAANAGEYDVRVQAGATSPGGTSLPFAYTRFYPEVVRVHRGQTVMFETTELREMHTVSFWPGGDGNRPNAFRRDELPGVLALNEDLFRRSPCGGDGQAACVVTGPGAVLSSGLPVWGATWRVTFDAPVGTYGYLCQIHPGMTGEVQVVADSVALPDQGQIDAQVRQQVEADTQEAIAHQAFRNSQLRSRPDGDRTIWTVLVGDATPSGHVSIQASMPANLEVRRGDAVEFVVSGVGHHTASFPAELVGEGTPGPGARLGFGFIHPACDLDDPASGAPGIDGLYAPFTPVECPGNFELILSPWSAEHRAPGDAVVTRATYHDSGVMFATTMPESARGRPAGSGDHFPDTFFAEFPVADTFPFACMVHKTDVMAGSIVVR